MSEESSQEPAGLTAKIDQILSRLKTDPDGDDGELRPGKAVPYDRFFGVNQRMKAAEAGLAGLKTEHEAIQTAAQKRVTDLQKEFATQTAAREIRHREDIEFVRRYGLDETGITTIRSARQSAPEAERGKSALDYWDAQVAALKAHAEDPEKNPAPKLHPTVAVLLPEVKADEKREPPRRGREAPRRGHARKADVARADARGKGRKAMAEAIRKERGW